MTTMFLSCLLITRDFSGPLLQIFPWVIGISAAYILIQILQNYFLFRYKHQQSPAPTEWPEISIWVAARDEESNIGACLESLCNLEYPKEKLQILVGNDQSSDRTFDIANEWAKKYPFIQVIDVVDNDSGLKAKARVMAQLDVHAIGEYYLITDADVRVKPVWAKAMIQSMSANVGVASGTTMVQANPNDKGWDFLWAKLQGIDWTYFMGLLNVISYAGVPATAVGNNMIVRKKAYWETGGYANIKFSITEDYKLYSEICAKGYGWNNVMSPSVLAHSVETKGFNALLHQRKRWLSGGKELPWYWWLLFAVFLFFYFGAPLLVFGIGITKQIQALIPQLDGQIGFENETLWYCLKSSAAIWAIKWVLQVIQINRICKNVGEPYPSLFWHLVYELYLLVVTIGTSIFFALPKKTVWKGRKY